MKFYNNFQVPQMMYLNYFDDVMLFPKHWEFEQIKNCRMGCYDAWGRYP